MAGMGSTGARSLFVRYWTAAAISSLGTAVTAIAMPVLVVQSLGASPFEVGVVNAAQLLPYAVLGLIAGVYTDRWRRKPILVWASIGACTLPGSDPDPVAGRRPTGPDTRRRTASLRCLLGIRVRRDPVATSPPGATIGAGRRQRAPRSE